MPYLTVSAHRHVKGSWAGAILVSYLQEATRKSEYSRSDHFWSSEELSTVMLGEVPKEKLVGSGVQLLVRAVSHVAHSGPSHGYSHGDGRGRSALHAQWTPGAEFVDGNHGEVIPNLFTGLRRHYLEIVREELELGSGAGEAAAMYPA